MTQSSNNTDNHRLTQWTNVAPFVGGESATNSNGLSLFEDLFAAGNAAPSADNNQPWMFESIENGLNVYWDYARRLPSDADGMFDMLALGAVVENIVQKLSSLGRKSEVHLVHDLLNQTASDGNANLLWVATIRFGASTGCETSDSLAEFIGARETSRFPFSKQPIDADCLEQIRLVAITNSQAKLHWECDRRTISKIGSLVALSDSLRFRYREFHEELQSQLRLTPEHAAQTRDGLDYRTLGLPPGGRLVLSAIRRWKTMSFLNRFGMASLLAAPSAHMVRQSGGLGFVFINDKSPQAMIEGGRAMQRIWLQATKLGLSIHPLGSLPIFMANDNLPEDLLPVVNRVKTRALELLPNQDGILQMAFRIGVSKKSAGVKSLRRDIEDVTLANKSIFQKQHLAKRESLASHPCI